MKKRRVWILLFFAVVFIIIDGASKYWVDHNLLNVHFASPLYPYGGIGVFQDFLGIDFCINRASNTGGAWGIFSSYPKALLFTRIGIILTLFIYAIFFNKERKRDVSYMLILTGAAANIIEFFIYGSVVDMFHFILWGYSFPVFNVADMMIFFGVATLLVQALFEKIKQRRTRETQPSQS